MKKNVFVIAAVATAMVSCAESEMKSSFQDFEEAINFEQTINKSTKAEIANEKALVDAGGFKVWAYKAKNPASGEPVWASAEKTTVFDGTVVTGASGDADDYVWSYDGKKYWDKTCSYKFFAAGANDHNVGTLAWADDVFTVTGAQAAKATESMSDFVIDRVVNVVNAATREKDSKVSFDFHHIMAKISFIVKNNIEDKVTVTSLKVKGFKESGNFTQNKFDGTWTVLDASEWATSGDAVEYVLIASSDAVELASADAQQALDSYIMIPQAISANNLVFTLSYKIGDEEFTDHEGKITTAQTWGTDSHTTYTIKVGPEAIEFDVASVCDFCKIASGEAISIE